MFLLTYKTKQNKSLANFLMIFYYKNFDVNVTFNYCTRVWSHSSTLNNLYLFIFSLHLHKTLCTIWNYYLLFCTPSAVQCSAQVRHGEEVAATHSCPAVSHYPHKIKVEVAATHSSPAVSHYPPKIKVEVAASHSCPAVSHSPQSAEY